VIDNTATFTAADALLADGRQVPALVSVISGELDCVYVYPEPERDMCWVCYHRTTKRWVAMNEPWFLTCEGVIPVPVDCTGLFPLEVSTGLPLEEPGTPLRVRIEPVDNGGLG
jgi:hypothetical protein